MPKFPWGDDAVPFRWILILMVVHCVINGALLGLIGPWGAVSDDQFPTPVALRGVALVTAAWVFLIYIAMGRQKGVQYTKKNQPTAMSDAVFERASRIAERGLMNTVEQMGPFLLCMWVHAIFVNPTVSTYFGWLYVLSRFFYGLFYGMYGEMNLMVEVVTQNNYVVIGWWLSAIVVKCSFGVDLHQMLQSISPFLLIPSAFLADFVLLFVGMLMIGQPGGKYIVKGVKWNLESSSYAPLPGKG